MPLLSLCAECVFVVAAPRTSTHRHNHQPYPNTPKKQNKTKQLLKLSPQVAVKPPYWRRRGAARFVYWMVPTLALSEAELLATAGLDALMFQRLIVLALQFFAPVAVLSCAVLIPLHLHANYLGTAAPAGGVQLASLMGLTMSNMPTASPYLW